MPNPKLLPVFGLLALFSTSQARCLKTETRGSKRVIVQMFEWNWDSIAAECTSFLGPAGYGYVQVSPPSEHIPGSQWWTDYQVVSYQLTSKRGNRAQFANMISTCHAVGVGVIVDTIWNHMTGMDLGNGVAGTPYSHFNYPEIYQYADFHHNCPEGDGNVDNYSNRAEVQNCQLVGLADLATEAANVRATLAAYGNDLISLGVDGVRLDSAKHMPSGDIAGILSLLSKNIYVTQEVVFGAGEPIQPSEYVSLGDVQEFRYTSALQTAFAGSSNIASLQGVSGNPSSQGWVPSSGANVFVANHDTERSGTSINYSWGNNAYTLANIFVLAYGYGTPTILSGYDFSGNTDNGAPNNNVGTCSGSGGANGWLCQHRWSAISGMVGFYNKVTGDVNNWVQGSNSQIAFGRGSSGFVVINYTDSPWTKTFTTSLPNGVYCDVIHGALSSGSCSATSITVSGGSFTVTVGNRDAVAIYTSAAKSGGTRKRESPFKRGEEEI